MSFIIIPPSYGDVIDASSYFGIVANTGQDMAARVETAINSQLGYGVTILLPAGIIDLSRQVNGTLGKRLQFTTSAGVNTYNYFPKLQGRGASITTFLQHAASTRHFYYFPSSGNIAYPQFDGFTLENANYSLTDINQAGIQIGGGAVDCVVVGVFANNVEGKGVYAVFRTDDCTGQTFAGVLFANQARYYLESGYNSDETFFNSLQSSFDAPINVACTLTTGVTLTGISALVIPYIKAGMAITGAGVQADTRIIAVDVPGQNITVDKAVTACNLFDCHLGIMASILRCDGVSYSGSGFATVANAANYANKTRASTPNVITFSQCLWNRGEALIDAPTPIYNLEVSQCYIERPQRVMRLGINAAGGDQGFKIDGVFHSQSSSIRQTPYEINGQEPRGYVKNLVFEVDITPAAVTLPNVVGGSVNFEVANVQGAVIGTNIKSMGATGSVQIGNAIPGNGTYQHDAANGNYFSTWVGFDRFIINLNQVTAGAGGAIGIGNPVVFPAVGKVIWIEIAQQQLNNQVNFDTRYKYANGTAIGAGVGAGVAAGTRAVMMFRVDGNFNFIGDRNAFAFV